MALGGQLVAVAAGGAAGAVARFLLHSLVGLQAAPVAVLLANVVGSGLAGAVLQLSSSAGQATWLGGVGYPLFVTGFCGAFTTMSAMTIHTRDITIAQGSAAGIGYATASVLLSVAGLLIGAWATR
ncbi:MAG: CrcB family protein [Pseudomonadota bacterium]